MRAWPSTCLRFVKAKAAQAVSVRELAEMPQLVFRERRLQFVGNVNESHAGIIAARGELPVRRPRKA